MSSSHNDDTHGFHESSNGPMEQIKNKELELRGKYLEVKKKAELIVAEARKKAGEIRRTATDRAVKESKEYYDQNISKIHKESVNLGDDEIVVVNQVAEKNFSKAREFVLKAVVPE